ncbi:MAG: hypothetical protein ACP5JR_04820, partial [Thermoplasmata archaeon]
MTIVLNTKNGAVLDRRNSAGIKRVGAVNGLTNGSGMTNGNSLRTNGRNKGTNGTNMKAGLAIIVFLILLIPPIMILMGPAEKMKIDGDLSDWADKAAIEQNPAGMGIPITKYAVDYDSKYVYFYVQVQSPHAVFESTGNNRDNIVIFLDTGDSGYRVDGIQAKYKVEISGSDGNVVSASLSEYKGNGMDWSWESKGSIEAKANIGVIEGRIKKADIGDKEPTLYILAQRSDGSTGRSILPANKMMQGIAITQTGITAEIIQPDANATLLTFNARAYGKDTLLTSITVKRMGAYTGALNLTLVDATNTVVGNAILKENEVTISIGRNVSTASDALFKIVSDVSGINGNSIGLRISGAKAEGIAIIYGETKIVYVGAPTGIIIDGAFGDWAQIPAHDDPQNDVRMQPSTLPVDKNIDINATKYTNDTNNVYFYAKVYGDKIFAGLTQIYRGIAGQPGGASPALIESIDAYDYAYINYTDTAIGKEYSIQITGKNGEIVSKKVLEREITGGVWKESQTLNGSLTVACAGGELELGVQYSGQITTYRVEMTNWEGSDATAELHVTKETKTETRGTAHAPIHINGNADFANQAANEGWPGDGTPTNPFIIDGYD